MRDPATKKKHSKTFADPVAAKGWRAEMEVHLARRGSLASGMMSIREAAEEWFAGIDSGVLRARGGDIYKPSTVRNYRVALDLRLLPSLGEHRLRDLGRGDVQRLVDGMVADGLDASTVRNSIMPLRSIYRWATTRELADHNPTRELEMPAVRSRRDRIVSIEEGWKLVEAVPLRDRAIWATAMLAGLRLGELWALSWDDVDFERRLVHVRHAFDQLDGGTFQRGKSKAAHRRVPLVGDLHQEFKQLAARSWREGLVLGIDSVRRFPVKGVHRRAKKAWLEAGLQPVTLHEMRHSYASMLIAAGVNAKAISQYMGHASVATTYDLYGHLMPDAEIQSGERIDAYIEQVRSRRTSGA
ncbi:MAG: tyrosine-type recombinase/integrase [Solirubrobacterales bacterium]